MKKNQTMDGSINQILEESFKEIVSPFIRYPQHLETWSFEDAGTICIDSRSNFADKGKILGSNRVNFNAIETTLNEIAFSHGYEVKLRRMKDPITGEQEPKTIIPPAKNWDATDTKKLLIGIVQRFANHDFQVETINTKSETYFKIFFSPEEKFKSIPGQIGYSLSTIFNAIGKTLGREIFVQAGAKKVENEASLKS
jgi:predicted RNA-binding protein YlqC (UPF0109 family)